jgi:hypothetical protein
MSVTNKHKNMEEFVLRYQAALKAKMSRQEFSYLIGMQPDSIRRKRLKVLEWTGLNLPLLNDDPETNEPSEEQIETYRSYVNNIKELKSKSKVEEAEKGQKIYVITSAQNATPIHHKFLDALKNYCEVRNAELLVIPYRYRNPTSIWSTSSKDSEYWDSNIVPYLYDKKMKMNNNVMLMGHYKIQPTNVRPLSGTDNVTGEMSGIFGHPTIQQTSVPTPSQKLPKLMTTTGSITVKNYTDSKTGHNGDFNHSFAALVVEIDGDKFFMRHVHADKSGSFYDLNKYYTPTSVQEIDSIPALVTGDIHAAFHDEDVEKATYTSSESIMNLLKPQAWVIHDIEDFYARNHHHRGDHWLAFAKHHLGRDNVEKSLQISADFIDKHSRPDMTNVIVKSNHDEALDRWLKETDFRNDPENAKFFLYMQLKALENIKMTNTGFSTIDPFEFWCKHPYEQRGLSSIDNTRFMKRDESFSIHGIEMGFHGDQGPNGSRGSPNAFAKIGPKCIVGHSHSPSIFRGVYTVGVSAMLNLEYASGPSSWMHTHCIVYPDGHRTLIHIINDRWKL